MTVDEFLAWAQGRPGRYEFDNGEAFAMLPEAEGHRATKSACANALRAAIGRTTLDWRVRIDNAPIRVSTNAAFAPTAFVDNGEGSPVIIVEISSPRASRLDTLGKLGDYVSLKSFIHYLVIDADDRRLVHYARRPDDVLKTSIRASGPLRLDPPGLDLTVEELFPEQ